MNENVVSLEKFKNNKISLSEEQSKELNKEIQSDIEEIIESITSMIKFYEKQNVN